VYRYGVIAKDQKRNGVVVADHPYKGKQLPCQKTYDPDLFSKGAFVDYPAIIISDDKQHDTYLSRRIVETQIVGKDGVDQ
jgi:hypothetical protein